MQKKESIFPTNDIIFQKIFGEKGNEIILKDFLESILEISIHKIILDLEKGLLPNFPKQKKGILDVRATLEDGTQINIEMQACEKPNMIERSLFYWGRLYTRQLKRGDYYQDLKKTITINILGYETFQQIESYKTIWRLREDRRREEILSTNMEIYFIEIPKFIKQKRVPKNKLEQWLYFLDFKNKEMINMCKKENPIIEEATVLYRYLTEEETMIRIADEEERRDLDYRSGIRNAELKGIEKGIEKGMEKGIKKGIKKGTKEGRKEGKEEAIRKMYQKGMKISQIADIFEMKEKAVKAVIDRKSKVEDLEDSD